MARTKDELKTYITDLAKEKNFTEAQTTIAVAAGTGDTEALKALTPAEIATVMGPLIDLSVGRQAEYSRGLDEIKTKAKEAADYRKQLETWRTTQVLPEVARLRETVGKFESKYGKLEDVEDVGGGKSRTATGDEVDTVDVDVLRNTVKSEMSRDFLAFELERSEITQDHWKLFKEPLDTRPLIDLITKAANDPLAPRAMGLREAHSIVYGKEIAEIKDKAETDKITAAEKRGEDRGRKAALAAGAPRSGAAVPAGSGAFWDHVNRGQQTTDADKLSDADRESLFSADLNKELQRSEDEMEARINS